MSEANSEWLLRHRDGVEHGPFQLADLVAAARAGNIASDTALKHPVHSHDQWVFATRVQPVAEAMTRPKQRSTQQPARASNPQHAPPAHSQPAQPPSAVQPQPTAPSQSTPSPQSLPQQNQPAATTSASAVPSVQPAPLRSLHSSAFPVPKTFPDAVLTLFDFRFQRFVTPWIIQFLWFVTVIHAVFFAAMLGYTMLIGPATPSPDGTGMSDGGSWQFDPLAGRSFLESGFFRFALAFFVLSLGVLATRVVCECAIIFFRVAIDVRELKGSMQEREN
jgi:hypothetical protein